MSGREINDALVLPLAHGFNKPALQARADLIRSNYTSEGYISL